MKSKIWIQDALLPVDVYKDGGVGIRIDSNIKQILNQANSSVGSPMQLNLIVKAHIKDAEGLLALVYLLDYLEDSQNCRIGLALPFVPNARQDRLTGDVSEVKPATLNSVTNILNRYTKVVRIFTTDVHSNITTALLRKAVNIEQDEVFKRVQDRFEFETDIIISPDFGAIKKATAVAERIGKPLGIALKERDPLSNEILETKILQADVKGKVVTIVDDMLDGGRTFIPLATRLKELGARWVNLVVTHGIFSYGARQLQTGDIDNIYVYYSWLSPEAVFSEGGFVKAVEYF